MICKIKYNEKEYSFEQFSEEIKKNPDLQLSSVSIENAKQAQIDKLKNILDLQRGLLRTKDDESYVDESGVLHEGHSYKLNGKKIVGVSEWVRTKDLAPFNLDEFVAKKVEEVINTKKLTVEEQEEQRIKLRKEYTNYYNSIKDFGTRYHLLMENTVKLLVSNPDASDKEIEALGDNDLEKKYVLNFKNYLITNKIIDFKKDIVLTETMVSAKMKKESLNKLPNKNYEPVLAGTIDLMVIKPNGDIIQYDYKTSHNRIEDWKTNKIVNVQYQQKFYQSMVGSKTAKIIPIFLNFKDYKLQDVEIDKVDEINFSRMVETTVESDLDFDNIKIKPDNKANDFIREHLENYDVESFKDYSEENKKKMLKTIIDLIKDARNKKFSKIYFGNKAFSIVIVEKKGDDIDKLIEAKAQNILDEFLTTKKSESIDLANIVVKIMEDIQNNEDLDIDKLVFLNENYEKSLVTRNLVDFISKYKDKKRFEFKVSGNAIIVIDKITKALDFISLTHRSFDTMTKTLYDSEGEYKGTILSDKASKSTQLAGMKNEVTGELESKEAFLANTLNIEALKLGYLLSTPDLMELLNRGYYANQFVVHSVKDSDDVNYLPKYVNRKDIKRNLDYLGLNVKIENRDWISYYLSLLDYLKLKRVSKNKTDVKKMLTDLSLLNDDEKRVKIKSIVDELKQIRFNNRKLGTVYEEELIHRIILQLEGDYDIDVLEDLKDGFVTKSLLNPNDLTQRIAVFLRDIFNRVIDVAYKEFSKVMLKLSYDFKKFYEDEGYTGAVMLWNNRTESFRKLIDTDTMTFKKDDELLPHQIKMKNAIKKQFEKYFNYYGDNIPLLRASTVTKFYDSVTDISSYIDFVKDRVANITNYESSLENKIDKQEDLYLKDVDTTFTSGDVKERQKMIENYGKDIEHNLEIITNLVLFNKIRQNNYAPLFNIYNSLKYIVKLNDLFKTHQNDSPLKTLFNYFDKNLTRNLLNKEINEIQGDTVLDTISKLSESARYITSFATMSLNYSAGFTSLLANTWRFFTDIAGSRVSLKSAFKASTIVVGNLGKGEDNLYNIGLVNLLNSYYRISSVDLDNITKRYNMSYKGFDSSVAYFLSSVPDYYFRMTFFVSKMIEDGTYDAHEVVDGELIYKPELDKRFSLIFENGKLKSKDSLTSKESKEQYALYNSLISDLKLENSLDENNKPLYAYSEKDRRNHKDIADKAYGSIDVDVKNEFSLTIFGKAFSQLRTYLYGLKDRYYLPTKTSESNIIQERKLVYINDEPKYIWTGKYQEGILQTLIFTYKEYKEQKKLLPVWEKLNAEQKRNLELLSKDLLLALFLYLLGKAMFSDDDSWYAKSFKNSYQDLFILNTLKNNVENFSPASYSFTLDLAQDAIIDITSGLRNKEGNIESKFVSDFALVRLMQSLFEEK